MVSHVSIADISTADSSGSAMGLLQRDNLVSDPRERRRDMRMPTNARTATTLAPPT